MSQRGATRVVTGGLARRRSYVARLCSRLHRDARTARRPPELLGPFISVDSTGEGKQTFTVAAGENQCPAVSVILGVRFWGVHTSLHELT